MKNLSEKKLNQIIKKNNLKFEKASKSEKVLMICKDVIETMKLRNIILEKGSYISSRDEDVKTRKGYDLKESLSQTSLLSCSTKCTVCMKGGLFLSRQRVGGNTPYGYLDLANENPLSDIFTDKQWHSLEYLFENWSQDSKTYVWLDDVRIVLITHLGIYYAEYKSNTTVYLILRTIINAKGEITKKILIEGIPKIRIPKWVKELDK